MIKFSWYTIPKRITQLITVYQYAVDRFLPISVDKKGFGRYIHFKQGVFVCDEDGGWTRYKPNRKGGHHHRQNYSQCIQCAKSFRKNKGKHNCRHRTKYIYYRFKTKSVNDPRPLKVLKPLGVPYWISGYKHDGNFELAAAIIVCYLPTGTNLAEYWDDAYDIETTPCNVIKYTSRFPKPDWLE